MVNNRRRVGKQFEKEVDAMRNEMRADLSFPQVTEYLTPLVREMRKRSKR